MEETTHLKLKKPGLNDYVIIEDLNQNSDAIDIAVQKNKDDLATHSADDASITKKGHVQLSSAVTSIDETKAATSKAVKTAMDRADEAFTSASNGKSAVSAAITGIDPSLAIPNNPTFSQLVTAISSIQTGKRFAIVNGAPNTAKNNTYEVYNLGFKPNHLLTCLDMGIYGRVIIGGTRLNPSHNYGYLTTLYAWDDSKKTGTFAGYAANANAWGEDFILATVMSGNYWNPLESSFCIIME